MEKKRINLIKEMGDMVVVVAEYLQIIAKKYDMTKADVQTAFMSSLACYLADND